MISKCGPGALVAAGLFFCCRAADFHHAGLEWDGPLCLGHGSLGLGLAGPRSGWGAKEFITTAWPGVAGALLPASCDTKAWCWPPMPGW